MSDEPNVSAIARLRECVRRTGSCLCVGLDPVLERLPAEFGDRVGNGDGRLEDQEADAIEAFSVGVVEAVADLAAAIKIQSACFERSGWRGVRAMERVAEAAKEAGAFVILDAKRGDIGISAQHYAAAAAGMGVDAITVNGYLGPTGVEPFLDAGLLTFCLVRTSNPDSDSVQRVPLEGGGTVASNMARMVSDVGRSRVEASSGLSLLGSVVAATKPDELSALRGAMPDQVFLMPGVGAQGGSVSMLARAKRADAASPEEAGVLVSASRSILYPPSSGADMGSWQRTTRAAASAARAEIRDVL